MVPAVYCLNRLKKDITSLELEIDYIDIRSVGHVVLRNSYMKKNTCSICEQTEYCKTFFFISRNVLSEIKK